MSVLKSIRFGLNGWLILLGVSAAIALMMPSLATVALITIIGIPIGIYLMAAPFLFLLVAGISLVSHFLGGGWAARIAGATVTMALLAAPPYFVNQSLDSRANAFVAEDHDDGIKPAGRIIAILNDRAGGYGKDTLNCDGFCQRALINGVADQILLVAQDLNLAIDPAKPAASFRMEKRAFCPPVKLPQGHDPIEIEGEQKNWQGKRIDELMQLEIAKGNCLIAETVPLGMADVVFSVGTIHRGQSTISAGLSLFADTVKADRITMHEKRGSSFVETYRWTGVVVHKLAPFYAPTIEGGAELRAYPVLARTMDKININEKYYDGPDWSGFLVNRMQYDLAKRADQAEEDTRTVLKDALMRPAADSGAPGQVSSDFFEGIQRGRKIEGEDLEIARKLLEDERFPVLIGAPTAVLYAKNAPPDYFDAIGDAMFKRLRAFAALDDGKPYPSWREEASTIGRVIDALPREAILKHRDDLEWLARHERLRVRAYGGLYRLSEFGADGAKTLLWLIDDSQRFKSARDGSSDDWQHPYLAGLTGLCRSGAAAKDMVQPFYDRLKDGRIVKFGSYWRLNIHTLTGMGANPDDMWQYLQTDDKNNTRARMDREVARAMKKVECYW
jgi:hypothetical protein